MAFSTNKITVATTATLLITTNSSQVNRSIINSGTVKVFIAGTSVFSTAVGFPLLVGEELACGDYSGKLYGRTSTANGQVQYVEDE